MFDAIGIAGTGLQSYHTWLDAIANNIANVNDTAPTSGQVFQTEYVQLTAQSGGPDGTGAGVAVTSVTHGDDAVLTYDPTSPMADKDGNILRSGVNLSDQMGDMIMAQRAFQANANVVDRAKDVYEAAIAIGKGL